MFPAHILNMNPFAQQRRQGCHPGFVRYGAHNNSNNHHEFWPFVDNQCGNYQCVNPEFNQENMCSHIGTLLHRLQEIQPSENRKFVRKDQQEDAQSCKKQEKCSNNQRKRVWPFQVMKLNDLMNAISTQGSPVTAREPKKWQHKVDCRGFESRNIKVKIDIYELLIKAFKKEQSQDGVSTSSMRKKVVLPKNIDNKNITCKLSPNGFLLVEATLLDKENKNNKGNPVAELMSMMLPGWKEFLEQHSDSALEKKNEENGDENPKDKQEDNENKSPLTELLSMMLPGWKEFLEQNCDNVESEKENITESNEKSKDDLEKNMAKELLVVNQNDEDSSTKHESGLCNKEMECEGMEVSENDNTGNKLKTLEENIEESNELLIDFENDKQDTKAHDVHDGDDDGDDDDVASNGTDESFILLSQTEEDGYKAEDKEDASLIENIEEESEKPHESTNESDSIMESEDMTADESHNVIGDYSGSEIEKEWEFRLEMPSYNPQSLKVSFDESKRVLEIAAVKDPNSNKPASIVKKVNVCDGVDVNGLKCSFRDGLLSVTAPYVKTLRSIPVSM